MRSRIPDKSSSNADSNISGSSTQDSGNTNDTTEYKTASSTSSKPDTATDPHYATTSELVTQTVGNDTKGFLRAVWDIKWEDKKILFKNLGKTIRHGPGVERWYKCPRCETQVWAYESFIGTPCWECMAGNKGAQVGYKASRILDDSGYSIFFNHRLDPNSTLMQNGFLERPLTVLKYSNFLVIYNKFIKNNEKVTDAQIIQMLKTIDANTQQFIENYEKKMAAKKKNEDAKDDSKSESKDESKDKDAECNLTPKEKFERLKYNKYRKLKYKIGKDASKNYVFTKKLHEYYNLIGSKGTIKKSRKCDSIPKKCLFLWSLESPIYHELANILESDDYEQINLYMPFIRGVNLFLTNHPIQNNIVTYRGSHMILQQAKLLNVNQMYRISKFLPTSEDPKVAEKFKGKFVVKLNIPKYCHNAAYIHKYSVFPNESEVLLPPYTVVKIIGIDFKEQRIEVNVLDNKSQDQELPQIHL